MANPFDQTLSGLLEGQPEQQPEEVAEKPALPAPGAEPAGPNFDDVLGNILNAPKAELSTSAHTAVEQKPDEVAERRKLSRESGIPEDAIDLETERKNRTGQLIRNTLTESPATADWLRDPKNSSISHDEVEPITDLERRIKQHGELKATPESGFEKFVRQWFKDPWREGWYRGKAARHILASEIGAYKGAEGELASIIARDMRTAGSADEEISKAMQDIVEPSNAAWEATVAAVTNPKAVWHTVVSSVAQQIPQLGLTATPGGRLLTAGKVFTGSFSVEYGNTILDVMQDRGVDVNDTFAVAEALRNPELMREGRERAVKRGLAVGVFDAMTAGVAGRFIAGAKRTATSIAPRVVGEMVVQSLGGGAGEAAAQLATEGRISSIGEVIMEAAADIPGGVAEIRPNWKAAQAAAQLNAEIENAQNARGAVESGKMLEDTLSRAESLKTRERDPVAFRDLINGISKNSPVESVFVDGALFQEAIAKAGLEPEVFSQELQSELSDALATGGDVRVSLGDYAAHILGSSADNALRENLKTTSGGMTAVEGEIYMQNEKGQFDAAAKRAMEAHKADDAFRLGTAVVEDHVMAQLAQANRFTKDVNRAYARFLTNGYVAMADRVGVTPDVLLQQYPLHITSEDGGYVDFSMSQGAPATADQIDAEVRTVAGRIARNQGITFNAAMLDGEIFLSLISVPQDKRGGGVGAAAMRQLTEYADVRGLNVRLLPTPLADADAVGTEGAVQRLVQFYERVGFELEPSGYMVRRPSLDFTYLRQDGTRKVVRTELKTQIINGVERIVGASPLVNDHPSGHKHGLRHLRKVLRSLALEGEKFRFWYENSSAAILQMVNGDKKEAQIVAALLAIYSPNSDVPSNTRKALNAYLQHKTGQKIKAGFGVSDRKAEDLLNNGIITDTTKVNSFYHNLMVEIDPKFAEEQFATMDMWMAIAFGYGSNKLDQGTKYGFAEGRIQELAEELGWSPHQVQAAIWVAMKARVMSVKNVLYAEEVKLGIRTVDENGNPGALVADKKDTPTEERNDYKHYILAHATAMKARYNEASLAEAGVDFADELMGLRTQVSWEATPSKTAGVLPGIHKASLGQKQEYLEAVMKVLTGENGEDLVAKAAGLPPGQAAIGFGAWEGDIGVSVQQFMAVPSRGGAKREYHPASKEALERYAALRAYILSQDAVAYHQPVFDAAKKNQNSIELRTNRSLTPEEGKLLYDRMITYFMTDQIAPAYLPEGGARIMNFEIGNEDFQQGIQFIIESLPDDFGGGVKEGVFYASAGDLISNNWKESPNGESYLEILGRGGRNLLETAERLKAAVEGVNRTFAERYGWDGQRYSQSVRAESGASITGGTKHVDLAGSATVKREALERVPEGFARTISGSTPVSQPRLGKNPIAVVGIHYGNKPNLASLDASFYASANPGREQARVKGDQVLGKRVYFYPQQQENTLPKSEPEVLGNHVYRSVIDNLYDFQADPDKILPKWREIKTTLKPDQDPLSALEKLVLESGYNGYINRSMNAAVVLGVDSVPVEYLGGRQEAQAKLTAKYQQNDPYFPERGAISFGAGIGISPTVISLMKHADLSTFIHESGHFFLEMLVDVASKNPNPSIQYDVTRIMEWFGVKDIETWRKMTLEEKRPHHEKFARGFEAYAFEGKAPSAELRSLFGRFRAWLISIYRDLTQLNVELNDEIRGVFNRLIATEAQIAEAEHIARMQPLFNTAPPGMDPQQWQEYQALASEATDEAINELDMRSMRDMAWTSNAKSRALKAIHKDVAEKRAAVKTEVLAELRDEPIYRVQEFLRDAHKLSLPALKEMYGDHPAAPWRYFPTGKFSFVSAKPDLGVHPDAVAEAFGFTSGDELVRKLLEAEPINDAAEALTDQRMLERYGEIQSLDAMEKAANEAIHNDVRGRFVATELKALTRATGPANIIAKAAKAAAESLVESKRIRDVRPASFSASEAKASRDSQRLVMEGNIEGAAVAKRNQLLSHQAVKIATDIEKEIQRGLKKLNTFNKESTRKNIDQDYLDQIDSLLERVDLSRATTKTEIAKRKSLAAWIKAQEEAGLPQPEIDEDVLANMQKTHFSEMTVSEFRSLMDAVRNIEHLGRLKNKLIKLAEKREFKKVTGEISQHINDRAPTTIPETITGLETKWTKLQHFGRWALAAHRKFSSLLREMDQFEEGGLVWKTFVKDMNDQGHWEAERIGKENAKLAEILAPMQKTLNEKLTVDEVGRKFTREMLLGVALNMGNSVNRERVLTGEKWTEAQLNAVLSHVTREEWDIVQKIWDYLESFRPEIAEKQKRVTGIEPTWVTAEPFQTQHGIVRGGYYPIKYDAHRSTRSAADEIAAVQKQLERGLYARTQTRRGHLEERVRSTGRALRYDAVAVISQHVSQVVHDLAWHEYLIDANRLINAANIDKAIREGYGEETLNVLREHLRDIAVGDTPAKTWMEHSLNHLRVGATIAGLGWNVITGFLQPLGLTQSFVRVGTPWVVKGMVKWMAGREGMERATTFMYDRSAFMRTRRDTLQREVREIRNRITGSKTGAIEDSYFWFIQTLQKVADIPTWLGMYEKMIAQGKSEADAVALADQAVLDAQGGGLLKDLAEVQKGGPLLKLWTNFYSFFNTTYNLAVERKKVTKFSNPLSVGGAAIDYLMLFVVPVFFATLMREIFSGGGDLDDPEKMAKKLAVEQVNYMAGTMIGLREMTNALSGAYDYSGPAGARFFAEVTRFGKQVAQGELDQALFRSFRNSVGILFHLPVAQVNRLIDYLWATAQGKETNPLMMVGGTPPELKK